MNSLKHLEGVAMRLEDIQVLFDYVRANNITAATEAKKETPRVKLILPYIDVTNGYVYKVEIKHGSNNSLKNFEVRFLKEGETLLGHIIEWLQSKLIRRQNLPPKVVTVAVKSPRRQLTVSSGTKGASSKIGTPADPFYNPFPTTEERT